MFINGGNNMSEDKTIMYPLLFCVAPVPPHFEAGSVGRGRREALPAERVEQGWVGSLRFCATRVI